MKIYTKKGDTGTTVLIGGKRVSKDHMRIESYGTIDELNSFIGLIRDHDISKQLIDELLIVQDRLFTIGSLLAVDDEGTKMKLPQISEEDIKFLEKSIDKMDENLAPMKSFVLPGGHKAVSFTHIARCVCRRGERSVVTLSQHYKVDPIIITYLNRLSDYLFTLSRKLTVDLNAKETPWIPKI